MIGMNKAQLIEYAEEVIEQDRIARGDAKLGYPATSTALLLAIGVVEHLKERDGQYVHPSSKPVAWAATSPHGDVLHISEADGWKVEPVIFDGGISGQSK